MPKVPATKPIPNPPQTISQIVANQLPDFVRDGDPNFIAFLQAYYEWMEKNGEEVFTCKILASTQNSVTLTSQAATSLNYYQGMSVVCLNGPAKGHTRKILDYDPASNVAHVEAWDSAFIPPTNTSISIRDSITPGRLLEYRDIDTTLDRFISYFRDEFMYQIPGDILADKRNILKHIKEFYQARGTENSFRFLFRIMFNQEVEFYYPKVDLFRTSDARWYVQHVMKVSTTGDTFDYVNRRLIGVYSGATAKVETAVQQYVAGGTVTTFTLSNIDGTFQIDPMTGVPEQVKIVYPVTAPPQSDLGAFSDLLEDSTAIKWESAYQLLEKLLIITPGKEYQVGEPITISGGGGLVDAKAIITSVFQTIFTGGCQPPPTTYYLEPFFGPDDTVNPDPDPTTDGVCIPGLYFFSDVHSTYTQADLLNSTEILLSANETSVDDFFVGDEIDLIGGTGLGQRRIIVSYNGTTKVATVDQSWNIIPDATTRYSITHVRGGIKSVEIIDFGLGFITTPTVTINTAHGSGGVLQPVLGIVGTTSGRWLSGRAGGIGEAPTTTDSFASSNKIIQDSYYWQDFSYDLRIGETIDKYRKVVKTLLHPAGFKMFGTVLIKSKPETNFFKLVTQYTLQIGTKFFSLTPTVSSTTAISVNTITPQVIGARNESLDRMKFTFPPNVNFNLKYAFPNQNYWSPDGPGNTQINTVKDIVIGDIISYPHRRTKINSDAYVVITNGNTITRVGPIGQSRAAIARSRFTGFPPYEGYFNPYPAPNASYWDGPLGGYGNTQISVFKDIVIGQVIQNSRTFRSNIAVDGTITIFRNGGVPAIGNRVEYSFLQGINPQIVYNISPNYHGGEYDGTLGSSILTNSNDGTYVTAGVALDPSNSEIVNASGVPLSLSSCTVVVIAKTNDITTPTTLLSMIPNASDNGFAIDLRAGGAVSFRARYDGVEKTVDFPTTTLTTSTYFMAVLRFNAGRLSGNVFTPNGRYTIAASFPAYPSNPTTTSSGWYFGQPSTTFTPVVQSPSLFSAGKFGAIKYGQAQVSGSSITNSNFNGNLSYALFYDRDLYDYELDGLYVTLSSRLLAERGVNMSAGTLYKTQIGAASIRKIGTTHTISGGAYIIDTRLKTLVGLSRIRRAGIVKINSGVTRIQHVSVAQTLSGTSSIRLTAAPQTLSGISRIQVSANNKAFSGIAKIQNTTLNVQIGHAALRKTTGQTLTGTTRLLVTGTVQTISGRSRIYGTQLRTNLGVSRIDVSGQRTILGLAKIQNKTQQTQTGAGRIRITTQQTKTGVSRITVTALKTAIGVGSIRVTQNQPQFGNAHIS